MTQNLKWKNVLFSITSKYSYCNSILKCIRNGISKRTFNYCKLQTLTCFHLINNVVVKWFPTRVNFVLMTIKVSINVPKLTKL